MNRFLLIVFLSIILPIPASAQCSMPNGPDAEMGVIVFNKAHKVMQYCNGDDWIGLWGGGGGAANLDNLNASNLTSGTVPMERIGNGAADNTTFLRGDGQWVSAWPPPPTCAGDNNALQWNGSAWNCATIEGGEGGFDLVNGQHSSAQCTGLGGEVVTEGGNKMCRINGTSCPVGWVRYQNWSTFPARSCSASCPWQPSQQSCTTAARAWSNNATVPTCTYLGPAEYFCENYTCTANITQIACY